MTSTANMIFMLSESRKGINPAATAFSKPMKLESQRIPGVKISRVPASMAASVLAIDLSQPRLARYPMALVKITIPDFESRDQSFHRILYRKKDIR